MKVLIADGSREVAARLLCLIEGIPDVEFLAPTATAEATLESVRAYNPDALLVDAHIPGARGTALVKTLRAEKPSMVLIILVDFICPQYRAHYAAAGADMVVDKANEFINLKSMVGKLARQRDALLEKCG